MWRPGSGSPNRNFVLGSELVFHHYQTRLRQIRDEWLFVPSDESEYALDIEARFEACTRLQEAEMDKLREECRLLVLGGAYGSYVVPI